MKKQYLQPTLLVERFTDLLLLVGPTIPVPDGGNGEMGNPDPNGAPWRY